MAGDLGGPAAGAIAICARDRALGGPGSAGGDFHAWCETAVSVRVIIGDVRGKGAAAAGKARLLVGAFPSVAGAAADLEQVSRELDHLVALDAAAETEPAAREWFATALLLEIDEHGRRVTVINHGHPAPVLVGPRLVRELEPGRARLPLGLGELAPARASADVVELPGDATLILFTDGVSEARDGAGRMFDPVARLAAIQQRVSGDSPDGVAANETGDPAQLLEKLYLEVARHNGGTWHDDLALVSVRRRTRVAPQPGDGARPPISAATAAPGPGVRAPA